SRASRGAAPASSGVGSGRGAAGPRSYERGLLDPPARLDEPVLAGEGLAGEARLDPLRLVGARVRPVGRRGDAADAVARVRIDDQLFRAAERLGEGDGILQRAELVRLAAGDQIGHFHILGVAVPIECLAKSVELALVGDAGHEHEAVLEGWRGFLEDRVTARLVAGPGHRAGAIAWLL